MNKAIKTVQKLLPSILPILAAIVVGLSQAAQTYISAHPVQGFSAILVAVATHWINSPRQ
ncbi:MAG: hypothetical protein ACRD2O_00145 [Terriglobia bacterium]